MTDGVQAYGLLGGTTSKITSQGASFTNSVTKTSFSYGIGAEGLVAENCTVGLEWFRPMTNVNIDSTTKMTVNAFNVSVGYKF